MLKKFNMEHVSHKASLMDATCQMDNDETGKKVCEKLYRGMIGSLLYLAASGPNIQFSTYLCARFQSNPKESHLKVVRRIFRYLSGTIELGLFYDRTWKFDLITYSNVDYAGSKIDRKSTMGHVTLLVTH